jgi:hypothetical protein
MTLLRFTALVFVAALSLGGCSLVVDFDRSLLVDAGVDGGTPDASVDGSTEASVAGGDAGVTADAASDVN